MNRARAMPLGAISLLLVALTAAILSPPARAADDAVMAAIQAELDRTMARLQLPDSPKPYFAACTLTRTRSVRASAMLGALTRPEEEETQAELGVVVRVGDYQLDNSNFLPKQMWGGWSRMDRAAGTPIDGNPDGIRRAIWWAADQAYKMAVENLKRKRAVLANRSTPPVADDLAKAPALSYGSRESPQALPSPAAVRKQVCDLSGVLLKCRRLLTGTVSVNADIQERWYANSEGTKVYVAANEACVEVSAVAQADDGVMVGDYEQLTAERYDQLPRIEDQAAAVAELGRRVEAMREAPLLDDFAGPILFEGQAAAELCARILPDAFSSRRLPVAEDEQMSRRFLGKREKESLRRKIGRRVMAIGFNVTDNPALGSFDGVPLVGRAPADLEGVKPEKVDLVRNGILKTLLTTRTPDKQLPVSNGHAVSYSDDMGESAPEAGITSLIVQYDNGLEEKDLRARLIHAITDQEVEYGLLVRRIPQPGLELGARDEAFDTPPDETVLEQPLYVFRVLADGREELVRAVALKGMTMLAFKDVLAAGGQMYVHNFSGRAGLQSVVAPSLLFEEGIVVKPERNVAKPPLLLSPMLAVQGNRDVELIADGRVAADVEQAFAQHPSFGINSACQDTPPD